MRQPSPENDRKLRQHLKNIWNSIFNPELFYNLLTTDPASSSHKPTTSSSTSSSSSTSPPEEENISSANTSSSYSPSSDPPSPTPDKRKRKKEIWDQWARTTSKEKLFATVFLWWKGQPIAEREELCQYFLTGIKELEGHELCNGENWNPGSQGFYRGVQRGRPQNISNPSLNERRDSPPTYTPQIEQDTSRQRSPLTTPPSRSTTNPDINVIRPSTSNVPSNSGNGNVKFNGDPNGRFVVMTLINCPS